MNRPHFFINKDAGNFLLHTDLPSIDTINNIDFILDLIDLPYYLHFSSDEESWTIKLFHRATLYQASAEGIEAGTLTGNKTSGVLQINAPDSLMRDVMKSSFRLYEEISLFIQQKQLQEFCQGFDPDQSGILLFVDDSELKYRVVSGSERPDLLCLNFLGDSITCRPYLDESIERSISEKLPLDEQIEAAEDGDIGMMDTLAMHYLNGDGEVEADPEKAVYWFRKMAEAGSEIGMFNLGLHYAKGYGVERDFEKAVYWMEQAAEAGDTDAPESAQKYRKLLDAMPRANAGDAAAQAVLAEGYMELGGSLEQAGAQDDYNESFKWAQKAANQNNPEGMYMMGLSYEHGRGCEQDQRKAVEYYQKGAQLGHATCANNLAFYYLRGNGVPMNKEKAFEYFLKAANAGSTLAMRNVGRCYQLGNGVKADRNKAIEWYDKYLEITNDPEFAQKVAIYKHLQDIETGSSSLEAKKPQVDSSSNSSDSSTKRAMNHRNPPQPTPKVSEQKSKAQAEKDWLQKEAEEQQANYEKAQKHYEDVKNQRIDTPAWNALNEKLAATQEKHKLVSEELRQLGFFAFKEKQAKKAQLKQLDNEIVQLNSELKKAADEALAAAEEEVKHAKAALNPDRIVYKKKILAVLKEIGIPATITDVRHASPWDLGLLSLQTCTSCMAELLYEGRVDFSIQNGKKYYTLR